MVVELRYQGGTLVINGFETHYFPSLNFIKYDPRINAYRCVAYKYADLISFLKDKEIPFIDNALKPLQGKIDIKREIILRNYQKEAIDSWKLNNYRGIIVFPTGSGKTYLAIQAMQMLNKSTLITVPTIELLNQWYSIINKTFLTEVGRLGGGFKEIKFITVSTYDSAYLQAENLGNKFEFVIFDEVHHLASESYRQIAQMLIAPFRMGLTATPERVDMQHIIFPEIVGDIVYKRRVADLAGKYLAKFEVIRHYVNLTEEEKLAYEKFRTKFKKFFEENNIQIRSLEEFYYLIMKSGMDRKAREALLAWNEARKIALNASEKLKMLENLLKKHKGDRILIFTEHNMLAKEISKRYLIPEITYKTNDKEREQVMEKFRQGIYNVIVTSKVLEEGIDVPEANVAIILSGSGSKREFIQRLGRILRPKEGKIAKLYEIVTRGTTEVNLSYRRQAKEELF
jgi:superfamily II DNA or RNA helicase